MIWALTLLMASPISLTGCEAWSRAEAPAAEWTAASSAASKRAADEAARPQGDPARCGGETPSPSTLAQAHALTLRIIQRRQSTFDPRRGEDFEPLLRRLLQGEALSAAELMGGWAPSTQARLRAAIYARHGQPLGDVALEDLFYAPRGERPPWAQRAAQPLKLSPIDQANLTRLEALRGRGG